MKKTKERFISGSSIIRVAIIMISLFAYVNLHSASVATNEQQREFASIRGVVYEEGESRQPIEFATITIMPQGVIINSNSKGEFNVERLSPGRAEIKIQYIGMETIDTVITLFAGRVLQLDFAMRQSSFRLNEVFVVAAESKAGKSTASNISRQALDHLQTSSLKDIMQLLPGGVTVNPDLSIANTITIRSIGGSGTNMNSMGTAIIVDGSPISNNSNLQTLSPAISGSAGAVGGGSSPQSGIDVRTLSTDNIESVEVIRGIPSVEYGDLTSGAVIIKSKAGREPLSIRVKTDPKIYQASAGKGFSLGPGKGNLNISGDYAYSISNQTESYKYFQRATAKVLYSNVFNKLSSNTSLDLSLGKDTREMNPDDQRSQLETGAKDIGVRINSNGTLNINRGWLTNIKYTFSANYRDKHSFSQQLLGNAFSAYSMTNRDGAVLSNRPGQRVYDINGNELTNISSDESSLYATYLPNEYFNRYDIYGKELNVFAKINATFSKRYGNLSNRIVIGADYKTDGNLGDGIVYDLATPPLRNLSSSSSSPRPRKYSSIPFINQISLYAEENLTYRMGERELIGQIGLRYDNIQGKSILAPRINASIEVLPNLLWLRGGYGVTAKAPGTLYLYPEMAYFDFVHFNTLYDSAIPESEQLFLASTKVYDTKNPDLEIAKNNKSEIGFDVKINRMRFSVTGYQEKMTNGYTLGLDVDNFRVIDYKTYEIGQQNAGSIPTLKEKDAYKIFVRYATPMNSINWDNKGVEFDFDFGRIHAIRTSIILNGAYMRSTEWDNSPSFSTRTNLNSLERKIGVYENGMMKYERESVATTLRLIHNIPSIGFVVTASAQVNWVNKSWTNYGNDTMFVSYISEDGFLKQFDPSKKDDPEFSYLFETRSPTRFIAESYFPVVMFNLHLTKEIGNNMKASFYANNMFNFRPRYESKRTPGSYTELGVPLYFGFELALTIR